MLIGIISDSHGQHLAVRKAMALFDELGVGYVIHCGDVGRPEVLDEIVGRPCTFVWGNMDLPSDYSPGYLKAIGIPAPVEKPTIVELDGKRFAVFHGHERGFKLSPRTLNVDYILHGHTHEQRDESINGKRIINPGALHRAKHKTVATLDTKTDELTFHEIRDS